MSLAEAIKFRQLISQLTHEECVGFLSTLVHSHLDILVTSLFRHFAAETNQINPAKSFNESLSDIIQSRKEKPKATSTRNIKLSHLPIAIIGHIASFSTQTNYFHFSSSNRSIYLGCNSPNLLHELDWSQSTARAYSCINFQVFPSVKRLNIDLEAMEFTHNLNVDSPVFNQVTTLKLDASQSGGLSGTWVQHLVQEFFDLNIVGCNTVTRLNCQSFGNFSTAIEKKGFLNLLSRFANLKHLKLRHCRISITAQDILNVCPNLVGLDVSGLSSRRLHANLMRLFASKLKCLSFVQYHANEFDFNADNFAKLKELDMFTPDNQSLNSILKSASNVEKIVLRTESEGDSDALMSNVDIKNAMEKIIVSCPHLKYMCLAAKSSHFCSVLDGIECGLFKTKQLRRTELKIHIIINEWNEALTANSFALNVGRIVNSLESSAVNDFMFICNLSDDVDKDLSKQIFNDLRNVSVHTNVFEHQQIFNIANPHCKINGFADSICGEYP